MRLIPLALLLPAIAHADLRLGALAESTPIVVSDFMADGHYTRPGGPMVGGELQVGWRFGGRMELGLAVDWSAELGEDGRSLHLVRLPAQISWVVPLGGPELLVTAEAGVVGGSAMGQGDDEAGVSVAGITAGGLLGLSWPLSARVRLLVQSGLRVSYYEGEEQGPGYFDDAPGLQLALPMRAGLRVDI